jgi:hypothetical protein
MGKLSIPDLSRAGHALGRFKAPRNLLVQWVPHGYGCRSVNLAFCLWICRRARMGDHVEVIVHEPGLAFGEGSWRHDAVAAIHRLMLYVLLRDAARVWISIPAWEKLIRPLVPAETPVLWLPVPSNVPACPDKDTVRRIRAEHCRRGVLIGHLGTYGRGITSLLAPALLQICSAAECEILLMGQGSREFRRRLVEAGAVGDRIHASGFLPGWDLCQMIAACDLLVQPYPDGISSRRSSAMAGLALGKAVVTTAGRLTEPVWTQAGAVAAVPAGNPEALAVEVVRLIQDHEARRRLGGVGQGLYNRRFSIEHTVSALTALAMEEPCASRS